MADQHWNVGTASPEGVPVMTKIDNAQGCRNEQVLKRDGSMWWFPDGSMYVHYRPTHWRHLTPDEDRKHRAQMADEASRLERQAAKLREMSRS